MYLTTIVLAGFNSEKKNYFVRKYLVSKVKSLLTQRPVTHWPKKHDDIDI